VNLHGEVIGINTAIASDDGFYQGYGFAIPANLARRVASDLIEHGQVRRAVIGVQIAQVDAEDADIYGLPQIAGARVDDFTEDSPARAAGLERHDVIVAVDGKPVDRVGQLQRLIAQHHPGEMVTVSVIRFGQPREFRMQLAQGPASAQRTRTGTPRTEKGHLGLRVGELSAQAVHQMELGNGTGGAFILEVDDTGPAARKGIRRGDRILAIDRKPIASVREAENALRRLRSGAVVSFELQDPSGRVYIANVRVP
jgi:serine protease Do